MDRDKRLVKKYKLDQLLRVARRLDMFANICEDCQKWKLEVSSMVEDIGNIIQLNDTDKLKELSARIEDISKHLHEQHKLIKNGHYVSIMGGIGVAVGTGTGVALNDFKYASIIGAIVFFLIGFYLDYRAKKEDRVI